MAGGQAGARKVGRYALYGEIASGGMATVHFGRLLGPSGFARTVAIKRLHPQFAKDPEFCTMFLDEARLAARIKHPNVVPILDVIFEGGELLLVMDYVHGESLARVLKILEREGARPPSWRSTSATSSCRSRRTSFERRSPAFPARPSSWNDGCGAKAFWAWKARQKKGG